VVESRIPVFCEVIMCRWLSGFPTFQISVLTSFSGVKFTMKVILSKGRSRSASHHHIPMSRNLTGSNATRCHVRAMKLTGIIQLIMEFVL